jgi:hypothetical protein
MKNKTEYKKIKIKAHTGRVLVAALEMLAGLFEVLLIAAIRRAVK